MVTLIRYTINTIKAAHFFILRTRNISYVIFNLNASHFHKNLTDKKVISIKGALAKFCNICII